jgi:hypothetical protein
MSTDRYNPPEDRFTNTVDGAAGYERYRASHDVDYFGDYEDYDYDDDEQDDEDYEDLCGCSDPCCPCDGPKRGCP